MTNVNWVDLLVAVVLVWGAISGFARGLTYHFPRLIAILVAIVVSMHFYERINQLITSHSSIPPLGSQLITLFLLSFGSYVVTKLILSILSKLANIQLVYFLERIVGALAGATRYILFLSLLSYMITMIQVPLIHNFYFENGVTGKPLVELCAKVHDTSMNVIQSLYAGFASVTSSQEK